MTGINNCESREPAVKMILLCGLVAMNSQCSGDTPNPPTRILICHSANQDLYNSLYDMFIVDENIVYPNFFLLIEVKANHISLIYMIVIKILD